MRGPKNGYVVSDIVDFLCGQGGGSVHLGVLSMQCVFCGLYRSVLDLRDVSQISRHILSSKIPVEVTVLCRFLELVTGSFIMASAFRRSGSPHGVTLPRSWILENAQKLHRVQNKDAHYKVVVEIMKPFQDLLESIYSGNDTGKSSLENLS